MDSFGVPDLYWIHGNLVAVGRTGAVMIKQKRNHHEGVGKNQVSRILKK